MILEIEETQPSGETTKQEVLTSKLTGDFEEKMNNNLDVKGAFDCLYENVSKTHELRGKLEAGNVKNVLNRLRRIDDVLQCIF